MGDANAPPVTYSPLDHYIDAGMAGIYGVLYLIGIPAFPSQKFSGGIFIHEITTDFTQTMFRERGAEITNRPPISHDSSTNKQ